MGARPVEHARQEMFLAHVLGWVVAGAGALILAGWMADVPLLRSLLPQQVEAKANTAVCFILAGTALALKTGRFAPNTANICAGLATLIGLVTLGEYVFGWNLGIDELLFRDSATAPSTVHPGRMAPPTALCFVLLGTALLLLKVGRYRIGLAWLAVPAAILVALGFVGQLYDLPFLASFGPFTQMAAPTGITFLLLSTGALLAGCSHLVARIRHSGRAIGLAAVVVLLLVMGGAVVRNTYALIENNRQVSLTHEVLNRLGGVLSAVQDVETGARGYVLTGDQRFLEPYEAAPAALHRLQLELRELIRDNPAQLRRLDQLEYQVAAKISVSQAYIVMRQRGDLAGAQSEVASGRGREQMVALRHILTDMRREENRLLELRQTQVEASTLRTLLTLGCGLAITIGLVLAIFALLAREIAAHRATESALRRNEEDLAVTMNSIGDAVLATDTSGRITRMNRMAEQLTGWPRAEARGRPIAEVFRIINEESRAPAPLPVDEVLATGEIRQLTNHTALIARDGTERSIADSAAPIRDPEGRILGVVLVFRDMTEERAAQLKLAVAHQELAREQSRLRFIFDASPVGIAFSITHADGRKVRMINEAHLSICGLTRAEAEDPEVFTRLTHPDDLVEQAKLATQFHAGKVDRFALDKRYIRPDGQTVWVMLSVQRRRHGDGSYEDLSMVADITAIRRAQEELDRFFSLSLDFLCIAGMDGRFKRASPAVTDILGWTVEEFLAQPYMEQIHPDDRAATTREVERQAAGHKVMHFENRFQHKDGSWRVLSWRSMPKDGLMYATARDVSDYKRTQEELVQGAQQIQAANLQLQAANTELEAFSYSVSHDLRAPLRHIQGYVEMLTHEAQAHLSDKARRYLKTITDAAREMGQLIDDLLSFSRMGRTEMQETTVDLAALIQEIRQQLERATPGRNIRWNIASLPKVRADAAMLRQVLTNLLDNAVKYTRPRNPAEIEIGCAGEEEGRIIFFVRDNGTGFDMQYAGKLFGVFQRLHRADEFEGTGIGLATVRRTIARHGGRTWADARLDAGATFYFTLAPAPAGATPTPARS